MAGVAVDLSIILEAPGNGCRVICWKELLSPDLLAYSQGIMGLAGSLLNSLLFTLIINCSISQTHTNWHPLPVLPPLPGLAGIRTLCSEQLLS